MTPNQFTQSPADAAESARDRERQRGQMAAMIDYGDCLEARAAEFGEVDEDDDPEPPGLAMAA